MILSNREQLLLQLLLEQRSFALHLFSKAVKCIPKNGL